MRRERAGDNGTHLKYGPMLTKPTKSLLLAFGGASSLGGIPSSSSEAVCIVQKIRRGAAKDGKARKVAQTSCNGVTQQRERRLNLLELLCGFFGIIHVLIYRANGNRG